MVSDDVMTINVGSFVHSMEFCRITSPLERHRPTASSQYRRIVMHDIVIMTGHSSGRIRAWDAKTGERCFIVVLLRVLRVHMCHLLSFGHFASVV